MVSLYLRHNLNFFTTLTTEKSVQFYATFMTPAEDTKNFLRLAVPKNKHQTFSSCAWCVKSTKSNERTTTNYYYPKEPSEGFNKKKVHPPLHTECVCKKKVLAGEKPEIDNAQSMHRILFVSESKISNLEQDDIRCTEQIKKLVRIWHAGDGEQIFHISLFQRKVKQLLVSTLFSPVGSHIKWKLNF